MTDQPMSTRATAPRVIRVFVSSTFQDMYAEREELVKRIFPQLRKLCEDRGVTWSEVDLRWGITDEQKAEGRVLPICLAEIARCRPYFIGILGERYGWIPGEIPPELIAQEPWLAEHLEHSVTELEILHGVLNNPTMADHAFFYLRDPAYIETLPLAQQNAFREEPTAEEVERYGPEAAQQRAAERQQKLRRLKARIRASGLPVRDNYRDPQELGEWVLRDVTAVIDRLYPEADKPDPLDRAAAEHEAFVRSRAVVEVGPERSAGVYIGRKAYFDRLDAHAASDGPPLVILGESGLGKSALLANWALRYRKVHPDTLVLMHFIGASPYSADWTAMLRRLIGEFQRTLHIEQDIPDQPDPLRLAFANALHMAAARGQVVLILDALNELEDRDQAPDLVWLPPVIPANVRLIVSTLPGRPLVDLKKRGWPMLTVKPLRREERQELIEKYLAQYTKALSPDRVLRIARAAQTANPLYLRALLEELRLFGEHKQLDERIASYLAAKTIPALYERILQRYEEDYERERPGLVRDAMTLLWAARRGLSETELLDLLGADGMPLPRAHWSPLYLAAEQSFVSRSGLIGFFHDYLRQAVAHRYLATESEQIALHLRLAKYFRTQADPGEDRSWKGDSARSFVELPFHLARSNAEELLQLLFDFNWLRAKADRALVHELLLDFGDAVHALPAHHPQREALELVESALRLSMPVIAKDRTQLASQLLARLSHLEQPEIRQVLESAKAWREVPWLMPFDSLTLPVLNKPGGRLLCSIPAHSEAINSVAISNDGSLALTGSKDYTVRVWDLRHAECLRTLEGHTDEVNVVLLASTAQGMIAITGAGRRRPFKDLDMFGKYRELMDTRVSQDNTIRIWGLPGGNQLAVLEGHESAVRCLALRENVLFSGSDDGTIRMWDLDRVLAGAFSNRDEYSTNAGKYHRRMLSRNLPIMFIATCDPDSLRTFYNLTDSEIAAGSLGVLGQHSAPVVLVAYTDTFAPSPTGHAVFSFSDYDFKVWDLITRGWKGPGRLDHYMNVVAVFPATLLLALQSESVDRYNYYLQIWDIPHSEDNNEHIKTIASFDAPFNCARFLNTGTQILVGGTDQTLRLIDIDSGKEVRFDGHKSEVTSVDVAETAGKIVSGSWDGTLILWELFRASNE